MKLAPLVVAAVVVVAVVGCGTPPATTQPESKSASPSGTIEDTPSGSDTPTTSDTPSSDQSVETPATPSASPTSSDGTASPSSGRTAPAFVEQDNSTVTVTCQNAELIVHSDSAHITAEGSCVGLIVAGDGNTIEIKDADGDFKVYGNDNKVTYSGNVTVHDVGTGNTVTRR